jgi:hypothetical protein
VDFDVEVLQDHVILEIAIETVGLLGQNHAAITMLFQK